MRKKFILTLTMVLISTMSIWSQRHWSLSHEGEGHSTETVVHAQLDLGAAAPDYTAYEVAAFVGEEARAVTLCTDNPQTGTNNYFLLTVRGNYDQAGVEDDGKAITFKMYNQTTGLEYDLTTASAVTFNRGSYGTLGSPVKLGAIEVEQISLSDFEMNKGETIDLKERLTLEPTDATLPNNITWTVAIGSESCLTITADGLLTATDVGDNLFINYEYGFGNMKTVQVTVKNLATAIKVNNGYETIYVTVGDETTLTTKLNEAISMTPADATDRIVWESSDPDIVSENMTNGNWVPLAKGEATMTAKILNDDGSTRLSAKLTVKVVETLSSFSFTIPSPMVVGMPAQIVVTPQPAGASDFDPQYLSYSISAGDLPRGWTLVSVASTNVVDGNVVYTLNVENPGTGTFSVSYNDGEKEINGDPQPLTVAVGLALNDGWQWLSPYTDIPHTEMQKAFTASLVEIRSQEALMANDGEYGYYGQLYDNGLSANVAYKVNMSKAVALSDAYPMTGGSYLSADSSQRLLKGWTWIGYPYYYGYELSAFDFNAEAGDRIVSFSDGFAEYDGTAWTGTLLRLAPRHAYLYYNNNEEAKTFTWQDEPAFHDAYPATSGARGDAPRSVQGDLQSPSTWQYDATRFSDNMSIVARLKNISNPQRYSIGAFVGNECRGEGVCVGSRMFITVHADQGEKVSFRLYDKQTGNTFTIAEQVTATLMLGSLSAPLLLTADMADATGIATHEAANSEAANCKYYDLNGRAIVEGDLQSPTRYRGITIRRMADGTVRKISR